MTQITVEVDGVSCNVKQDGAVTLTDIIPLFEQALRGCGFHFNGHVDIVEE